MNEIPTTRRKILLANPSAESNQLLADEFVSAGYVVRSTVHATEALAIIEAEPPDLAVLALRFPDFNGLDLLKALKSRSPNARVVVITMYGDIASAVAAVKLGAVDYRLKPVKAADILLSLTASPIGSQDMFANPDQLRATYIEQLYRANGHNLSLTARLLGMHRRSLQRQLKRRVAKR